MSEDLRDFEEALLSSRDDFITRQHRAVDQAKEQFGSSKIKEKKIERPRVSTEKRKASPSPSAGFKTGYIIRLAVREKRIALDELFEYQSGKLSKLEATMDAEKAARKAGYPIIGYVHSIEKL